MKYIQLSKQGKNKGKYQALVDDQDYDRLNKFRWSITNNGYAIRRLKDKYFLMHREIIDIPKGMDTDHINRNKLDNRRKNLRIATRSQNNANQRLNSYNSSGYKGVSWNKTLKLWMAYIKVDGKRHVQWEKNREKAAEKYNQMAKKYFQEFANLNIIKW